MEASTLLILTCTPVGTTSVDLRKGRGVQKLEVGPRMWGVFAYMPSESRGVPLHWSLLVSVMMDLTEPIKVPQAGQAIVAEGDMGAGPVGAAPHILVGWEAENRNKSKADYCHKVPLPVCQPPVSHGVLASLHCTSWDRSPGGDSHHTISTLPLPHIGETALGHLCFVHCRDYSIIAKTISLRNC